jgi:hypothetical protein
MGWHNNGGTVKPEIINSQFRGSIRGTKRKGLLTSEKLPDSDGERLETQVVIARSVFILNGFTVNGATKQSVRCMW